MSKKFLCTKNMFLAALILSTHCIHMNAITPTTTYEFSANEKQELNKATINGACLGAKEGIQISAIGGAVGATFGIVFTGMLWYCDSITLPTNKKAALDTLKNAATSNVTKVAVGITATFVSTSALFGSIIMRNETAEAIKNGTYYQPNSLKKINIKTSIQLLEVLSAILNALSMLQTR